MDIDFIREYRVPNVENVFHMSFDRSDGGMWVSNSEGTIVKIDQSGGLMCTLQTSGGRGFQRNGFHTITEDGNLVYIDRSTAENVIMRRTPNNTITTFINTGESTPYCVHSSHINGDILVGMLEAEGDCNVTRYDENGEELEIIKYDKAGSELYAYPIYITENATRYVCVSDYCQSAVVAAKGNGKHRFSYRVVQNPEKFKPYGICAYNSETIFVCDQISETIHLVKHRYSHIRPASSYPIYSLRPELTHPRALCLDNSNNIHVGQSHTNLVKVYKFFVVN